MPSDKRARQREGRQSRQEALEAMRRQQARRRRIFTLGIPIAIALAMLVFLNRGGGDEAQGLAELCPAKTTRTTAFEDAPANCVNPEKTYRAVVKTSKGDFTITLDAKKAPKTVSNFIFLAQNRYYDGVGFHRIIPGFVVQGGDPEGTGSGGPGYQFADELPREGEYKIGSVAMANSGPNTNGSQFFVITGQQGVQLPPSYSLFGQVTRGMDVVKKLEAVGTPGQGTPSEEVRMTSVRITES
jgi:peptidylprolyl isomerase/peptidyl-prolyl cis-trans isomerase B (cyclophilin B)